MQEARIGLRERSDLVVVTSFNEFHENTHIEPSKAFGHQYIVATWRFSEKLKAAGGWDPREASFVQSEPIKSVV